MDNLSGMAIFTAVVEAESFTKAAQKLGMSKSAVSKQVTRLEDRLGTRLLNRTTRKLSLTDTGHVYYERCQSIVEQAEEATLQVSHLQEAPRGILKLSASMSFGIQHLSPCLADFMQTYPELSVDLELNDRKIDIIAEGFDLALRIGEMEDSSLIARKIANIRGVTVASPAYLKKHGRPNHPKELENHKCLRYSYAPTPNIWSYKLQGTDEAAMDIRIKGPFISNNGEVATKLAVKGIAITRIPLFICWEEIASGELIPILEDYQNFFTAIYAVYPHNRHLSAKVRAFVDFMVARFSGDNCYWDKVLD